MSEIRPPTPPTAPPRPLDAPPTGSAGKPRATPWRYSMQSLLILVTAVAVLAALLPYTGVVTTLLIVGLISLMFVGPVCLGTLALYCRGYKQTFFMGAFAGSLSTFYLSGTFLRYGAELFALVTLSVLGAGAAGACACMAVATRRFVERRGWHLSSETSKPSPLDRR